MRTNAGGLPQARCLTSVMNAQYVVRVAGSVKCAAAGTMDEQHFQLCWKAAIPASSTAPVSTEQPETVKQDSTGALARAMLRPDGIELYTREYLVPAGTQARGVVLMVHGWTWHSGYFAPFAEYLTSNGFNVVTFDLRSHGLSGVVDGIRGCVQDTDDFVKDTVAVLKFAQEQNAGLPCFVWGESMGAMIILRMLTGYGEEKTVKALKGFIISATPVKIPANLIPPAPIFLALVALARFFPKLPMPTTMTANFDGSFGDTERIPEMRADPLIHWSNPRLGMMASFLSIDRELLAKSKQIDIPYLSLYGEFDIKTEVKYAQEMYDYSVCKDKTFKMYEGGKHQLLQDKADITAMVMHDSMQWMSERVA